MGWREYISFEPSEELKAKLAERGVDPSVAVLPPYAQQQIIKTMDEFWRTPEGRDRIMAAANNNPDKVVRILYNGDDQSAATNSGIILLGDYDAGYSYPTESGGLQQGSIQNLVFHELCHLSPEQNGPRGDEGRGGASPSKEREAIELTNDFMYRYYNEEKRKPGASDQGSLREGTVLRYFNPNFNPNGYHQGKDFRSDYQQNGTDITAQPRSDAPAPSTTPWMPVASNG